MGRTRTRGPEVDLRLRVAGPVPLGVRDTPARTHRRSPHSLSDSVLTSSPLRDALPFHRVPRPCSRTLRSREIALGGLSPIGSTFRRGPGHPGNCCPFPQSLRKKGLIGYVFRRKGDLRRMGWVESIFVHRVPLSCLTVQPLGGPGVPLEVDLGVPVKRFDLGPGPWGRRSETLRSRVLTPLDPLSPSWVL